MAFPRQTITRTARVGFRFQRTLRFLAHMFVWSRVFAARRGVRRTEIPERVRRKMGVSRAQPELSIQGPEAPAHIARGFRAVNDILFANLRRPDLTCRYRSARPAPAFSGVYLWDSAFISLIWDPWDAEIARDVLRSVIELREGDRLQHMVSDFVKSPFTQPPLIAWAATRLSFPSARERMDWYLEIYEPLRRYHDWLLANRRLENGLFFWIHPYESGVENAPRFGSADELDYRDTRNVAAPDFSAYMALQSEALAEMAQQVDPEREHEYLERASEIRALMNQELWHSEDGLYYDRLTDGTWIRSASIASLAPLAAGAPDAGQVAELTRQILAPNRFGSLIPLPSVAIDDPEFALDMWRGPVWINMAYLVICGLERYGQLEALSQIAWRLCDGVYRTLEAEHHVYEFYDPERFDTTRLLRKKGNSWKRLTLGSKPQRDFVGWSGLVNTLIIRHLMGCELNESGMTLRPCFPEQLNGMDIAVSLPQREMEISMRRESSGVFNISVRRGSGETTLRARFGERIPLE